MMTRRIKRTKSMQLVCSATFDTYNVACQKKAWQRAFSHSLPFKCFNRSWDGVVEKDFGCFHSSLFLFLPGILRGAK